MSNNDTIYRQAAIDALWKALFKYEDDTEKQFQESDELDLSEWMVHRIFVQNMSDIDRQTILNLPSAQPEIIHCESCEHWKNEHLCECLSRHGTFETPKNFYCGYGKAK